MTSSSGYPPPPPPPPQLSQRARTRSRSALPVEYVEQAPKPDPISIPINTPAQSRGNSIASTADYRSRTSKRDQSVKPEDKRSRSRNGPEFV